MNTVSDDSFVPWSNMPLPEPMVPKSLMPHDMTGLPTNVDLSPVRSRDPDNKVHEAYMGPIWGRQDPGGPHVGPHEPLQKKIKKSSLKITSLKFHPNFPGANELISWVWTVMQYVCRLGINGLTQEKCNSSALAMELPRSCTNPSICCQTSDFWTCPEIYTKYHQFQN